MIKKLLIAETGEKFFVKDLKQDFHCQFGYVKASNLKKAKPGSKVKTNTGVELCILNPSFIDIYKKISRGPQIIIPKDIGAIITEIGIGKSSTILDAGGGT